MTTPEEDRTARQLASDQRKAIRETGVPPKDVELLVGGRLIETPGVLATRATDATILVLSGPPGCGKTTAASSWLWRWVRDPSNWNVNEWLCEPRWRAPAVFTTAARIARMSRFEEDAVESLLKASRLVLDDLGAEYLDGKGNVLSLLDELVNERYAARRPTLITTNCTVETFRARYGERVVDRLREVGRFVSIAGPSLRGAAA